MVPVKLTGMTLRTSFSRLALYHDCPLRYRYLEVERLPEPDVAPDWGRAPRLAGEMGTMPFDRAFGAAVHRALRSWQEGVDAGAPADPRGLLEAVEVASRGLDAGHPDGHLSRALARIKPHLRAYAVGLWPRRRTLALEHALTLCIADTGLEVELALRVDRAVAMLRGAAILDFKTVSPHAAQRARDHWQLRTYALARGELGIPSRARLRLVIIDLLGGRAVEVRAGAAEIDVARERLLRAARGVAAADFRVATRPQRPCWSCGFRLTCPRSQATAPPAP